MAEKVGEKKVFGGVSKIVITPFEGDIVGENTYTLLDCIEGTTAMTKEEGDTTEIKSEQGQVIYALNTPGTRTFTTETGDLQDEVLKGLFGFRVASDGTLVEPNGDPNINAQIEIFFAGGTAECIAYKVKLNPSVTLENLNAGIARGVINGTLLNVKDGMDNVKAFGFKAVEAI